MIFDYVVSVLQKMSGQDGDDFLIPVNHTIVDQPLNTRDCSCRGRFASDAVAPDDCFRIRDLLLVNARDPPARLRHRAQSFRPRYRLADLDRSRQGLWMLYRNKSLGQVVRCRILFTTREQFCERRRSVSLNHLQPRQAINHAKLKQLLETFTERRAVAEITTRHDDMIRNLPRALLQEFGGYRLLAFD